MNRSTISSDINKMKRRQKEIFTRYIVECILGFSCLILGANVDALLQLCLGALLVLVFSAMYDLDKYSKLGERIDALNELQEKLLEV